MDTATPSSHDKFATAPEALSQTFARTHSPLLLLDVRKAEDFAASEYFLPGTLRWDFTAEQALPDETQSAPKVLAYCVKGAHVGITGAERLRAAGLDATFLAGGLRAWQEGGGLVVKKRPDLGVDGERISKWVTRERPKIDRIACPWLVKRFIDPRANFFYVPSAQVFDVAKREGAVAYDIPGAPLEHNGALCSFDAFLNAFELKSAALEKLATIVRGADTDALHLAPQSAGLLAISLGLSKNYATDDHAMLAQGMVIYDALYAWCLAETAGERERHNWVAK